ncbi:phosphoglucomutase (alpha-D-glucose-1,6-bisphosphate-dependent) [Desulfovibrio sp. OttesenSCG-928-O18]|nr:phosphoglucomutase (alpha-D-glucose-1,6-bisphosphate-dependent) [Desulfovibrio sp. OttesenSCG-928-O18]
MAVHPEAGKFLPEAERLDVAALMKAYQTNIPDPADPLQRIAFGTSGHRGSSLNGTFTESHILAVTQAVCDYRTHAGIRGPLYVGVDTHALSFAANETALEVLAANNVAAHVQKNGKPTPTPVISRAILRHNAGKPKSFADGIVITPSHNPPADGGFKYNPPNGGPADTDVTGWIEKRANELLAAKLAGVKRAAGRSGIIETDFIGPYVAELAAILDMDAIAGAKLHIGVDPLGGASYPYWEPIAEKYGLDLTVTNREVAPDFHFVPRDHDGKIRMDCSSPYAMSGLLHLASQYDIAFGNDPDADRHGIVTPKGLMNPNHYLAAAVWYLYTSRLDWPGGAAVGKTLVSSSMQDKVAASLERKLYETPVGFKWFVEPFMSRTCAFGGEESAGASFLQKDGSVWTTDKDGLIMGLLAAEMTAKLGKTPADVYEELTNRFGSPCYERKDAAATPAQKKALASLTPERVTAKELAGSPITAVLTRAPGNNAPIGGLKVVTADGWFAARPSGTEDIYKIYAESFRGPEHLAALQLEAEKLVTAALMHVT